MTKNILTVFSVLAVLFLGELFAQNPMQGDTNRLVNTISGRIGIYTNGAAVGQVPIFNGTKVIWGSGGGGGGGGDIYSASNNVFTGANTFYNEMILTNQFKMFGVSTNPYTGYNSQEVGIVFTNSSPSASASVYMSSGGDMTFNQYLTNSRFRFGFTDLGSYFEILGPSAGNYAKFDTELLTSDAYPTKLRGDTTIGQSVLNSVTINAPTWTAANGFNINSGQFAILPDLSTVHCPTIGSTNGTLNLLASNEGVALISTNSFTYGATSGVAAANFVVSANGTITRFAGSSGFNLTRTRLLADDSSGFEIRTTGGGANLNLRSDAQKIRFNLGTGGSPTNLAYISSAGFVIGPDSSTATPIALSQETNITIDVPTSIAANSVYSTNFNWTGVRVLGTFGYNSSSLEDAISWETFCTNNGTLTIRARNNSGSGFDPATTTLYIRQFQP